MSHRRFQLVRHEDVSGVSGTGVVAEGVEFSDGVVALRWIVPPGRQGSGFPTSVVFHDNGMGSVEAIHGHSGSTEIVWLDDEPEPAAVEEAPRCTACNRSRTVGDAAHPMDAYDYSPLQVVTGQRLGWYSSEDEGDLCPEDMEKTLRPDR